MTYLPRALFPALLCITAAANASAFNIGECLSNHTKAECSRQMRVEEDLSKPLASGDEISATSGKYTITVQGDAWLRNGWGSHPEQAKDLGITKDTGVGVLNYELSDVADADFEKTITEDMKALFKGLQDGFKKGKINIKKNSEMELLPLTISGANGLLGRFCYTMEIKTAKSACVYEGFIGRGTGESVKFLGSIGDYDNMRADMEAIITSFKFKE